MSLATASLRSISDSARHCCSQTATAAFRSSVRESLSVGTFQRKIHSDHVDVEGTLRRHPTNSAPLSDWLLHTALAQAPQQTASLRMYTDMYPHRSTKFDSDDAFLEGQSVVVVGAGPAGTCAAMALANAGASVTVYERRSEHTFVQVEGEPYAIVLEKRALDALADAGFLDADFHGSTYLGTVRVDTEGNPVAFQAESDALACERRALAESLRKHAAASNPAKIAFKFGYECAGGDLERGEITFRKLFSDTLTPASFDLLIGADGQCSRVRDILEDQVPEFTIECSERSDRVLHSFTGLSPHHEIVLEPSEWREAEESDDGRSLVLWTSRTPGITLSMHRRPDGTFSGHLGGNQDIFQAIDREAAETIQADNIPSGGAVVDAVGLQEAPEVQRRPTDTTDAVDSDIPQRKADVQAWIKAWRSTQSRTEVEYAVDHQGVVLTPVDQERARAYKSMLCKAFAGLPEDWADTIAHQAVETAFVPEPDSIKCSQLHGPRTVLIGDAAHCSAPVLGQGANSALEDVSVLVDTLRRMHELRRAGGSTEDAMHDVAAFTRARKHDVHALIDLNRYMVGATNWGPFAALAFLPLLVHVTFGQALSALPWMGQPAVTRISEGIPYSTVVRSIVRDFAIFVCIFVAILLAIFLAR